MNQTTMQIIKRATVVSSAALALILTSGGAAIAAEAQTVATVTPTTFAKSAFPDVPNPIDAIEKAADGAGRIVDNPWTKHFLGCQKEGSWHSFLGGTAGSRFGPWGAVGGGTAGKIYGCIKGW